MNLFPKNKVWYKTIWHLPRRIAIFLVKLYQRTISPDHGPLARFLPHRTCRFHPTCSEYSITAYEKYGFVRGTGKTVWRLLRCNPWNTGGIDQP